MATGTNSTEEIIEKRASAPVATSCLIIACVAILGAIAFQVAEIAEYRSGRDGISTRPGEGAGEIKARKDIDRVNKEVEETLAKAVTPAAEGLGGLDLDTSLDTGSTDTSEEPLETEPLEVEEAPDAGDGSSS